MGLLAPLNLKLKRRNQMTTITMKAILLFILVTIAIYTQAKIIRQKNLVRNMTDMEDIRKELIREIEVSNIIYALIIMQGVATVINL